MATRTRAAVVSPSLHIPAIHDVSFHTRPLVFEFVPSLIPRNLFFFSYRTGFTFQFFINFFSSFLLDVATATHDPFWGPTTFLADIRTGSKQIGLRPRRRCINYLNFFSVLLDA